jgi:small neutral amino acid transporter SnatA (MarC family)
MPGVASPAALYAVVLLTDNPRSLEATVLTVGIVPIVLVALLTTPRIQRLLGNAVIRRHHPDHGADPRLVFGAADD